MIRLDVKSDDAIRKWAVPLRKLMMILRLSVLVGIIWGSSRDQRTHCATGIGLKTTKMA